MAHYAPIGPWQTTLSLLSRAPGWLGRKARKKLRRSYVKRALAHFEGIRQSLRPGDVLLDLGANYGAFTELLAETGATVHAFEPDPVTFEKLQARVGHLPNVTLYQNAVAGTGGQMTLHRLSTDIESDEERRSWGATLYPMARSSGTDTVKVAVLSFDEVVARVGSPVKLVKMDIEGAEIDILKRITANPHAYDVATIYAETHENLGFDHADDVLRLRKSVATFSYPDIHLYWP